ncbi:murein L,D-transpeptidase [Candidatus Kaiserbacteria bacterium]|nr:murein L,D-transpeptidase [Candidatus Kaiserbacteria bacterium]
MARLIIFAVCLCLSVSAPAYARHHRQTIIQRQDNSPEAVAARAGQPLSPEMIAKIEQLHMTVGSLVLIRIFKREKMLEVWKQDSVGRLALLKSYAICRLSGGPGPKSREGDRQSPEGFYTVTPDLMNPESRAYLSFSIGFPNVYDQANGRTGSFVMVHGACASIGCFAMTNKRMGEIYALVREAFAAGQQSMQVQIFPFRMTAHNMRAHHRSKDIAFWRMLKEGSDHFEVTRHEPKVDVCERRYVFDAQTSDEFKPTEVCPHYTVPSDIIEALREKHRDDDLGKERQYTTRF